ALYPPPPTKGEGEEKPSPHGLKGNQGRILAAIQYAIDGAVVVRLLESGLLGGRGSAELARPSLALSTDQLTRDGPVARLGRAVSPGVVVAVRFDIVRRGVTGGCWGDRLRKHNAEAAGPHVDGLHLEGDLAGEVNAEQGAAVRLCHPARLGDAANPQTASG